MTNNRIKQLTVYLYILTNFVSVFAQGATCSVGTDDAPNPTLIACVLGRIIYISMVVAGAIFLAMIAYGAIKLGTAAGDPKGYEGAKQTWTYALIGVMIILGISGIFSIIGKLFGINFLDPNTMIDAFASKIQDLLDIAIHGN